VTTTAVIEDKIKPKVEFNANWIGQLTANTRFIVNCTMVLLLSAPLAILVTLLTFPFWNWFENITGIESFGHSGPADWCYMFDYIIMVVSGLVILFYKSKVIKKSNNIS